MQAVKKKAARNNRAAFLISKITGVLFKDP